MIDGTPILKALAVFMADPKSNFVVNTEAEGMQLLRERTAEVSVMIKYENKVSTKLSIDLDTMDITSEKGYW